MSHDRGTEEAPPERAPVWSVKGLLRSGDDAHSTTWRIIRRWFLAFTVAMFPFLFIIDEISDPAISPVLPGIVSLALLWVVGPFVAMEARIRWGAFDVSPSLRRQDVAARYALGAAVLWFTLWLVFL